MSSGVGVRQRRRTTTSGAEGGHPARPAPARVNQGTNGLLVVLGGDVLRLAVAAARRTPERLGKYEIAASLSASRRM